ncbi:N-formylglutamate amidohydrolase [Phyllobacterium sp. 21LDTY02-6]|uniref:N-formylglutamate amidohydrolase n=1 Tax=unclassified Phyllobacterium TaxID=2638441 RepID=UPI002020AA1B|nr:MULTISPECIES: N-formylglutamate amidohydrolase [unclassified Phyllobacterium]MCO4317585.1 N-formylglutamate amidohydrolase [Phyllobacterium sp. 21LDTY02-6]MCX8293038.1 N-formylglutamate amidohydrolase [Phyllobacterium sp. 0TCS1.6A]
MSFAPFHHVDGDDARGMVLLADHARRDLPEEYGSLGLPAAQFDRHIAYDIGVEDLTRKLAARLGVPAVLGGFSRLLIDPNRGEDDPTLIMRLSDGAIIPRNNPMPPEERRRRIERYYRPYHDAVSAAIARVAAASGAAPLVISVHSFTAFWKETPRPWHAGILWDSDPRAVLPLLAGLRADPLLVVGDNEPYDGALRNDTMFRHCVVPGYAHALIEVRQDLIGDDAGTTRWRDLLAPILEGMNATPDIHVVRHYTSRTGPMEDGTGT